MTATREHRKAGTMQIMTQIACTMNCGDVIMVKSKKLFPPVCEELRVVVGGWEIVGVDIPCYGASTLELVEVFEPSRCGKNWLMSVDGEGHIGLFLDAEKPYMPIGDMS